MQLKKWLGLGSLSLLLLTGCSDNKKTAETEEAKDDAQVSAPDAVSSSMATLTLGDKTYTFKEVGAIGYQKENSITVNATHGGDDDNAMFTLVIKTIKEGQEKFRAPGNAVQFTGAEGTFSNTYKDDCSGEDLISDGTISVTKLTDYATEKEGRLEGSFEGELAVTRPVPDYPCANGKTSNRKTELVKVKGSFKAGYINTKEVPL
jgi:hypothetical protein